VINTILLFTVMALLAAGQFLFKQAGLAIQGQPPRDAAWTLATLPAFYFALALYGLSTVLWIVVLSRVPLTQAYPWMAGAMIVVPVLGWLFFNEQVAPTFWIGVVLIAVGLVLTQVNMPR
jgi:drug/metabolite transporter (DMT)-like permease